MQQQLISR